MKIFNFKLEAKKYLGSSLIAAFGLITALAWKDVLAQYLNGIVSLSPVRGTLITALIISFISLIAVIIITIAIGSKK